MSKIALALKYRPKTFSDVVEQNAVKATLMNQLETNTVKNCYLFTGAAGTGKTTDARIFANDINKGKGSPIEMDAASNNSVEDMRRIIEQAKYQSMEGEYKVFILDEVHSFSNAAWQSFLKICEEPPAKTIFLLCLEENGLVCTKNGLKKIKDICPNDYVWCGEDFHVVSNVFNNGQQECLKITLSNGEFIKCTPNHKIKVLQGTREVWKNASDLSVNDAIAIHHSCYNKLSYISNLTINECWFLGYLTGNGHYTDHSIEFYTPNHKLDYIHKRLDECITEGWLHHYKDVRNNGSITTQIHFSHGELLKWYNKTGCCYNYRRGTKSIPNIVYQMSTPQIMEFVQGWYDADGSTFGVSFFAPKIHPQLNCCSEHMIYELQQILISHGFDACIYHNIRNNVKLPDNRVYYGIHHSYTIFLRHQTGYFHNTELENWLYEHRLKHCEPYIPEAQKLKHGGYRISPTMLLKSKLQELQGNKWFCNIISIEPCGVCNVYDIEVPDVHEFIYNGIKVHNCTTDPQKIPNTILSRVQRYDFKKISFKGIVNRLNYIINEENKENANIVPTEDGIEYIAKLADGGMRDAITTLDKCISYNKELTLDNVIKALGGVNYDIMFSLAESIYNFDAKTVIEITENIYNSGANIKQFVKDFSNFILDLCKYGLTNAFDYLYIPSLYVNKLKSYTNEHFAFFNQLLGEVIKLSNTIKWESNPKPVIESTFILLCQKV